MKNLFGFLPDKMKAKYHVKGISKVVVAITSVIKPALTIIDGFVAMEGRGPSNGSPVQMNLIIAGKDGVATDATGCRVMGMDPHKIKHIMKANEKGLGNIDNIHILGEKLESFARQFKPAKFL